MSKQCVFLGYNDLHKGYKCLDVSSGRIYISRDVIFDEEVFPFSNLHPNAGAHLRFEIALLHQTLIPHQKFDEVFTLDAKVWSRLRRHVQTRGQDGYYSHCLVYCCVKRMEYASARCAKCLLAWVFGGRSLYGTTSRCDKTRLCLKT
jgi:hypothetical protein